MSDTQNYANHVYRPRAWLITYLVAAIAMLGLVVHAYDEPTYASFALLALAGVGLSTLWLIRIFALRLQNRIIRLEMQIRLARLGREAGLQRLSMPQLVALRFASDAELPALMDRAIAEQMTPDAIKREIREWQGDYLRT